LGELSEGLPGAYEERGMCGEKRQEPFDFAQARLGRPDGFLSWVGALGICPPPAQRQVGGL